LKFFWRYIPLMFSWHCQTFRYVFLMLFSTFCHFLNTT
jgi:hypothetical protein